jgi:preprotein translocase subunit SecA
MLQKIGRLLGGDPHKKAIQQLSELSEATNAFEKSYEALSDDALRSKTDEFRQRFRTLDDIEDEKEKREEEKNILDELLPEAFAAVREASKRTIGLRHYDVQLIGGAALHQGKIVEMRTGEGKTLVATLPIYLNALTGRGTHLVTVNDYLARRDARWMAPIYNALGLSVGVLQMSAAADGSQLAYLVDLTHNSPQEAHHQLKSVHRREAYLADVTYGTNSEFGFDYLRDNLTMRLVDRAQRPHYYAIVDEVDNILIDEARTPLIISGPASEETEYYTKMAQVVRQLRPEDYEVNEKDHAVSLTEIGEGHVEELLETTLRDPDRPEDITPEQARLLGYLEQALRAQFLYRRNKDYLVQSNKVVIVDEFTGRLMPGRRWSEGLHQAVEAKEGVKIEPENVTYATITLQNYFRMYQKLAGMTGTAITEAEEFYKIYKLDVQQLPTNLEYESSKSDAPLSIQDAKDEQGYKYQYYAERSDPERKPRYWKRKDYPDVVYRTVEAKLRAMTQEIIRFHIIGRPQLVGTTSVEHSERISNRMSADSVRRLAQVLILRQTWMEQHNMEFMEQAVPELQPFNQPLPELDPSELRKMGRSMGISISIEDPENVQRLKTILRLADEHLPRISKVLQGGVPHQVLNARKHDEESQIIARAGAFGGVTIATNMAGRGVDIKLGGELPEESLAGVIRVLAHAGYADPYDMKNEERRQAILKIPPADYGVYEEAVQTFLQHMADMERVHTLGGLHVVGSERHEARRIDNQLRGRAARQGDPGSSRFYLSLEDDLMRLFGGQQADGLFKRLKVDENMPIEHNLLGRLVEQSQERVEGTNFDIRKHLLEYDDVLNSQRKRIYSERDQVFTTIDLSETITEMVKTEMGYRIPLALKDKEGPWKLLAYLEEIQPAIEFEDIVYPSYSIHLLMDDVKRKLSKNTGSAKLQEVLLEIAQDVMQAEKDHLITTTKAVLEQTEDRLSQQRTERSEIIDNFFSTMGDRDEENAAPVRPQALLTEISESVHVPLNLNNDQMRRLPDGDTDVKEALINQVEANVVNLVIQRLVGSIERRLEESIDIRPNQFQGIPWDDAAEELFQAMIKTYDQRMERLLGPNGQIAHDLDAAITRFQPDELNDDQMIILLHTMAHGTRAVFDRKTHRRGKALYLRLNYAYHASQLIEEQSPAGLIEDVVDHLNGARAALGKAWGKIEWARLAQGNITLENFEEGMIDFAVEEVGEERYEALAAQPLLEFNDQDRQDISEVFGKRLQNEVNRHLLLTVISEQWVDYLTRVEALRVSIGMEAYAQKDPLVVYKGRATEMFGELLRDIRTGVISRMFTYAPRRVSDAPTERDRPESGPANKLTADTETDQSTNPNKKRRHRH